MDVVGSDHHVRAPHHSSSRSTLQASFTLHGIANVLRPTRYAAYLSCMAKTI